MLIRTILLRTAVLLVPGWLTGQPLTLQEAVNQGLQQNPSYQAGGLEVRKALASQAEERFKYLPQVGGEFQWQRNLILPATLVPRDFTGGTGTGNGEAYIPLRFGTNWATTAGISLEQKLWDPVQLRINRSQGVSVELARVSGQCDEEALIGDITQAYYALLLAGTELALARSDSARCAAVVGWAQARVSGGRALPSEANDAMIKTSRAEIAMRQARSHLSVARHYLAYLVGMDSTAAATLVPADSLQGLLGETTGFASGAEPTRPEGEQYRLEAKKIKEDLSVERSKALPVVSLLGYLGTGNYNDQLRLFEADNWFGNSYLAFRVRVPFTSGMERVKRRERLQAALEQKQLEWNAFGRQVTYKVFQTTATYQQALADQQARTGEMALSRQSYDLTKVRYEQGRQPLRDLLESESQLLEAQKNYLRAIEAVLVALLNRNKALGKLRDR
jgi:outer membrane protein TolC